MTPLSSLLKRHRADGTIEWIGLSEAARAPILTVKEVEARIGTGLMGDRHARRGQGKRQITLMQAEHLAVISSFIGRQVAPEELRRNLLVQGINLYALRKSRFCVGDVLLEGTGPCDPCSRMETNLGDGGLNACRGHGGITAIVLKPGVIRLGDQVRFVETVGDVLSG